MRLPVLVVEDEPVIRMIAVELLSRGVCEVLEADEADEVVGIRDRQEGLSLFVTDVDMPGARDGVTLAWMVRNRWPECPILVTSGRALSLGKLPAGKTRFFPELWAPLDLIACVSGLMDGSGAVWEPNPINIQV